MRPAARLLARTLALTLLLAGPPAAACDVCYGASKDGLVDAARLGTWLLLGVTAAVQVSFATFFLYLRRRARQAAGRAAGNASVEAS